jgi:hypothetical protein
MKTNFLNFRSLTTSIKNTLVIAIISFAGLGSAFAATEPKFAEKNPTITSLGVVSNQMVFNLKYENAEGDKFEVVITDQDGFRLFRQVYTEKNMNRTFKVPADLEKFVVRITNIRSKSEQKFEISNRKRVVEDIMVTSIQ